MLGLGMMHSGLVVFLDAPVYSVLPVKFSFCVLIFAEVLLLCSYHVGFEGHLWVDWLLCLQLLFIYESCNCGVDSFLASSWLFISHLFSELLSQGSLLHLLITSLC